MMSATCNPDAISLNQVEDMGVLCAHARESTSPPPLLTQKRTPLSPHAAHRCPTFWNPAELVLMHPHGAVAMAERRRRH
ncbi:hypothetical protein BHM03_00021965 [Ensete ventricosum]|nr:hypothetical protein BHM03_00021965 [Ensete ventricosum]